ncbi:MAG: transketolase family protein [Candidatus Kerfeldbacteria bacterium]|nr:transketolase family protein [Candidatus Kerfeldbacteria bacterium]
MSTKLSSTLNLQHGLTDGTPLPISAIREGFGKGMLEAGKHDPRVVGLSADLTESTQMHLFAKEFPDRFVQVGVAEQNLATVASGLAAAGKIPFASSFAAFSPGRNWEQIRTTICYNNQPVKMVGSHSGLSAGPDGATHQILEDVALMRVLPNMVVVVPADAEQTRTATLALAQDPRPAYLRLVREKTPVFTTPETPFEIGKAQVISEGSDVTIVVAGPFIVEALKAAAQLGNLASLEIINMHTISPFDHTTLIASAQKTGRVITIEDHQIIGGLAGAVCESLAEHCPTPVMRLGLKNTFGESGQVPELWKKHNLSAEGIVAAVQAFLKRTA